MKNWYCFRQEVSFVLVAGIFLREEVTCKSYVAVLEQRSERRNFSQEKCSVRFEIYMLEEINNSVTGEY